MRSPISSAKLRPIVMHEPLPRRTAVQADVTVAHVLHRDIETRSTVSLKKVGAHKYAADPSTEVLCVAYRRRRRSRAAVAAGAIRCRRNSSKLQRIRAGLSARTTTLSKPPSSSTCWRRATAGRSFRSSATAAPWRCALALGLPAKLSAAADALELANRKDAAGERLMHQMSKPRQAASRAKIRPAYYWFDDRRSAASALRLLPARRRGRARAV